MRLESTLPHAVIDPAASPMILSDCTCCDWCAYCGGLDMQGDVNAVEHAEWCSWMALQSRPVPIDDGHHRHVYAPTTHPRRVRGDRTLP